MMFTPDLHHLSLTQSQKGMCTIRSKSGVTGILDLKMNLDKY